MENLKLANIEIEFDFDNRISKVKIDGTDYSNKVSKVATSFDSRNRIPIVKLEFYCDSLKIKGDAKVNIDEISNKK